VETKEYIVDFDWDEANRAVKPSEKYRRMPSKTGARLVQTGVGILGLWFFLSTVGRVAFDLAFSEEAGMRPLRLMFAIPVWTIGGIGLLLLLAGKLADWLA
jgi:hypothetical protein